MRRVCIILILIIYPTLLIATADGPDYWAVKGISAPDILNVRSQPTWKSSKIGALEPLDDCIKLINCVRVGKKQSWCKIRAYQDYIVGWVNAKYLKESAREDCHKFDKKIYTQKVTQLPINIKQNMRYSQARKILINNGWQSNKSRWQDVAEKSGRVQDFYYKQNWQEIDDCSGTGMAYCSFNFSDAYGNQLQVVTVGESDNPVIDNWSLSQVKVR